MTASLSGPLSDANDPLLLLVVPIAMIGRRWGRRLALVSAAVALALVVARAIALGGEIGLVGYLTRATVFVTVATVTNRSQPRAVRGDGQIRASDVTSPAGVEWGLSMREREVLAALAEGATNAEIAKRLLVSETTVQSHVKSILRKLGARNRTEAAARYFRGTRLD
jgi:DNA-binding NarL/FixJ family response regulator